MRKIIIISSIIISIVFLQNNILGNILFSFTPSVNSRIEQDSSVKGRKIIDSYDRNTIDKNDKSLLIKTIVQNGELLRKKSRFDEALLEFRKSLALSFAKKDTFYIVNSLRGISNIYNDLGIADSAFIYCLRELQLHKKTRNYLRISKSFIRLYSIPRYTLGGLSESKFVTKGYLDSSLVYAEKSKNPGAIAVAMANYGDRTFVDNPEKGIKFIEDAIETGRQANDSKALSYVLIKSYNPFWKSEREKEAESNLKEALAIVKNGNNYSQLAHIYMLLAMIEDSKGNMKYALELAQKSVSHSKKTEISQLKRSVFTVVRRIHKKLGNTDSVLYYLEKYSILAEKAHNNAMNQQVALLSAKYKVSEKEEEIELLDKLNEEKKLVVLYQNRFISSLIVTTFFIVLLLFLLYRRYKETKKAYMELTKKNIQIQKHEEEINRLNEERRANIESKTEPLKIELSDLFEKEKVFLDKELSLKKVVSLLNTNSTYLSSLINNYFKCSFTQYVNKYRILYACDFLKSEKGEMYSIEGIAEISGFVSRSAFNRAFKENTGLTPSTFRKNIKGE